MYIQDRFRDTNPDSLHAFIRAHALATLVVCTPELEAFLMPLELVASGDEAVLRGHAVRTNHLCTKARTDIDALAVFQGANAYISPRWYVRGQASGKVAPSWNYSTVHASGPLRFIDDSTWIHAHLTSLVDAHESDRENPWRLTDAPIEFVESLVQRLVGLEIRVKKIEGKRFLSQHTSPADRESLIQHLREEPHGEASDVAADIARASL
jgi:transcriptional regulator